MASPSATIARIRRANSFRRIYCPVSQKAHRTGDLVDRFWLSLRRKLADHLASRSVLATMKAPQRFPPPWVTAMDFDPIESGESPPRYSLWAIAIGMALCGIVFAILRVLGAFAADMTILFIVVSLVHLGASYLSLRVGHKRRTGKDRPTFQPSKKEFAAIKPRCQAPNLAECTQLSRWQIGLVCHAVFAGAIVGVLFSRLVPPEKSNLAVLFVCVISCAALAGMLCFVTSNLIEHTWRSLQSAHQEDASQAAPWKRL